MIVDYRTGTCLEKTGYYRLDSYNLGRMESDKLNSLHIGNQLIGEFIGDQKGLAQLIFPGDYSEWHYFYEGAEIKYDQKIENSKALLFEYHESDFPEIDSNPVQM